MKRLLVPLLIASSYLVLCHPLLIVFHFFQHWVFSLPLCICPTYLSFNFIVSTFSKQEGFTSSDIECSFLLLQFKIFAVIFFTIHRHQFFCSFSDSPTIRVKLFNWENDGFDNAFLCCSVLCNRIVPNAGNPSFRTTMGP